MLSKEEIEREEVKRWVQSNKIPQFIQNYIEQLKTKANKYDSLVKEIKDTLERIEKLLDNGEYAKYRMNSYELEAQKEVLQELLEGK